MDDHTILASTTPPNTEASTVSESVVIQQHDTVINNSVKKDICSVNPLIPSGLTPMVSQSQVQTANDPVSQEDKGNENSMEVEQVTIDTVVENNEGSTVIHQEETIVQADIQQVSTTEVTTDITMKDIPNSETNAMPELIETADNKIDAAILGDAKIDAADGYVSSDLDSSDDEDNAPSAKKDNSEDNDSESDSDDDSDSEEDIGLPTKTMTIEEREKALIDISYMDEEDDARGEDGPLRTRNELQKVVVQRPTITIKPEANIVEIGSVYAVVGDTVVVQGQVAGNEQVLDSGSLFVYEDREILGEVFETFGPVARPLYSVRFNDASEIDKERTKQGAKVYIVPDFSTFLLTRALKMQKGSDASNIFDEEVADHEMEFSDDEAEQAFKKEQKRKGKKTAVLSFSNHRCHYRKKQANKRAAPQEQQPVAESTWDDLDGYNVLKRPAIGRNAPEQRRPHPLPPRPAFSMTPATQEPQAAPPREVHSISQLFAAGPPPLHPPPRGQ
ncbi:hypothetical protein K450DRAFT_301300 [Umbelopsis ramanniana AG]|uniref:H/ACA ribonucleoprotein complex non-core subunit NAF1 n=1 Tax=Umbelopsis ramanniana AG TaxID=1314678 RepID=A0AAD5E7E3_UMBRA|nr:uncharacterized protein K450DRAFT_301300 [Umbelopsis ramanniana AG]KAI8578302.1 hypothetical protein K450DRAFT_301300 [Umbelopsis ramanniana AG]